MDEERQQDCGIEERKTDERIERKTRATFNKGWACLSR